MLLKLAVNERGLIPNDFPPYPTVWSFYKRDKKGVCADAGYRGTFVDFVKTKYGEDIEISEKIKPKEWKILPKR
ncbi:MAG: hypothetical protein LBK29_04585 [Oscillospiraceae bacterium]|jgi:hypothetical protein|nr:hypothetical protein [Oscillospiraceae bacterium]